MTFDILREECAKILNQKRCLSTSLVENTGLEPVTSCMPCKRSSQLS